MSDASSVRRQGFVKDKTTRNNILYHCDSMNVVGDAVHVKSVSSEHGAHYALRTPRISVVGSIPAPRQAHCRVREEP